MLLAGALGLVLAACASAEVADEVEQLRADNEQLTERVEELEASIARLGLLDFSVSGIDDRVAAVEGRISSLDGGLASLDGRTLELFDLADSNYSDIESLQSCVNEYMDTIARWSSNVGSTYTYYYC